MNDNEFQQIISRVEMNKSDSTAAQYVSKIKKFRDWIREQGKEFEEADALDIEDWLAELDEFYSNSSSVGKASAALVAAFDELNKLIVAGRIEGQGWPEITPPKRADYSPSDTDTQKQRESKEDLHYLKPEQVDTMAKETEKLRNELIIRLLFQTGVRVSELCEIREKDVDTDKRRIKIRGKGRKNRTVYYQPSLDLLIDIWQSERRPAVFHAENSPYLFPTSHSENITRYSVAEIVRDAADEAGFQEIYGTNTEGVELHAVTPHVLRHSFAMEAIANDWDVYTLSQALGHESTDITTSTYLHDDADSVRDAYRNRGPAESAGD